MEEKIKCGCCGFEDDLDKWSLLEITEHNNTISAVSGYIYNPNKGEREYIGRVNLYACPTCKMITFSK